MLGGELDGVLGLFEVGARHHEFLAAGVLRALQYPLEVVWVSSPAVIYASEHGIAQVDANLVLLLAIPNGHVLEVREPTSMYFSFFRGGSPLVVAIVDEIK